jgi:hypothetical protein
VVVSLETTGGRVIDWQLLNVIDPDRETIRPDLAPTFGTTLTLHKTPRDGRIWVDLSALDESGHLLFAVRREITIGPATQTWM